MKDLHKRSLIKTISWRITGSMSTFAISYVISDNLMVSGSIAVTQLIINTVLYYLHERAWNCSEWGQQ